MSSNLLQQIRSHVIVDVDSMDPAVALRHTSSDTSFCDMTSNQAIVYNLAIRPESATFLKEAIQYVHAKGLDQNPEVFVNGVIDVLTVLLAKQVFPLLTGHVHAQASPKYAYDTLQTIEHAKKLVALFEAHGIPKDRVCIKIPATPESIVAMQYLSKVGIKTLATCLFSVPQAVAASQAGCLYVAPYFNELRVHFEPTIYQSYSNPATEHPMSQIILGIVQTFKEINSNTLVMPASIVTAKEVIALASLKPDHITISASVLDELSSLPPVSEDSFVPPAVAFAPPVHDVDYLASSAIKLKDALASDHTASGKLVDALSIFQECEDKTRVFVQAFQV
ncbi:aldolase [Cyathus striatus]|nr:aldolase [Cyathus striatus]